MKKILVIYLTFFFNVILASKPNQQKNPAISGIYTFGYAVEKGTRLCKDLPQYRYIARPIYKTLGGAEKPLISVPITFMMTDLICHGILPEIALLLVGKKRRNLLLNYGTRNYLKNNINWRLEIRRNIIWTSLGLPVAYVKHKRNQKNK